MLQQHGLLLSQPCWWSSEGGRERQDMHKVKRWAAICRGHSLPTSMPVCTLVTVSLCSLSSFMWAINPLHSICGDGHRQPSPTFGFSAPLVIPVLLLSLQCTIRGGLPLTSNCLAMTHLVIEQMAGVTRTTNASVLFDTFSGVSFDRLPCNGDTQLWDGRWRIRRSPERGVWVKPSKCESSG